MARWLIWTITPYTGSPDEVVAEYSNKGHAAAALRGFVRRAWLARSEMKYALRKG